MAAIGWSQVVVSDAPQSSLPHVPLMEPALSVFVTCLAPGGQRLSLYQVHFPSTVDLSPPPLPVCALPASTYPCLCPVGQACCLLCRLGIVSDYPLPTFPQMVQSLVSYTPELSVSSPPLFFCHSIVPVKTPSIFQLGLLKQVNLLPCPVCVLFCPAHLPHWFPYSKTFGSFGPSSNA